MKLRALFRRRHTEAEMAEEMRFHLDQRTADFESDGIPPDEARYAAQRKFGNLGSVQELAREAHGWSGIEALVKDTRFAVRHLVKTPGFSTIVVLTLALGIGANTAIFSFFYGILLRPLPFDNPERVVALAKGPHDFTDPNGTEIGLFAADFRELQSRIRSFADFATYTLDSVTLTHRDDASLVSAVVATPNFFSVLGARAALGRTFQPIEGSARGRLAVISHRYWQTQFGGTADVLGQTVTVNQIPLTIIGVMPADFSYPREAQLWTTPAGDVPENALGQPPLDFAGRGNYVRTLIGRLAPGITVASAEAELSSLFAALPNPNRVQRVHHLISLRDHSVGEVRVALAVLLGCAGLVLLLACLNVANLTLSRATGREREIAIRLALGASRWRVGRQLLTETMVLTFAGGTLGVLTSFWALNGLVRWAPADIPRLVGVRIDGWVLGFAAAISVLTGIVSGLAPIFSARRTDFVSAIRSGDRANSPGAGPKRLRTGLIAGEVAIALVLLVAASLLLRSLARMEAFSWGFQPQRVVSARVAFLAERYASDEARLGFFRTLRDRLSTTPGIESFGTGLDRIGVSWINLPFTAQGETYPNPADRPLANYHVISPSYFTTLGITLRQGRDFNENDGLSAPRVVLIDSSLARGYFGGDAIGKTMRVVNPAGEITVEVVGVVGDVRSDGPVATRRPDVYFCYFQYPQNNFYVHVRSALGSGATETLLKKTIHAIDGEVPVTDFATMDDVTAKPSVARHFPLGLLGGFAALALLLATVGIYGVTNYAVTQRTREIGIRMALGASRRAVLQLILKQGFHPVALGLGAGLIGAVLTAYAMRQMLFDTAPLDVPTFALVPLGIALVAVLACLLPARHATRVDPLVALRAE